MIIGVCGFIGSGKDTIADYLTNFHGFRRESFASTLKDAVAQVFGWDRTLLEGRTKQAREWRERVDPWWAERLNIPHSHLAGSCSTGEQKCAEPDFMMTSGLPVWKTNYGIVRTILLFQTAVSPTKSGPLRTPAGV